MEPPSASRVSKGIGRKERVSILVHVIKWLIGLTVENDFGVPGGIREVGFCWTTADGLLLVRVALGDVVGVSGVHAYDVLGAGHEANVEAPEAIGLFGARADHEDHVVLHASVAVAPDRDGIVRDVDLAVGHLVLGDSALGDEHALEFGGEVAGGGNWKGEKERRRGVN